MDRFSIPSKDEEAHHAALLADEDPPRVAQLIDPEQRMQALVKNILSAPFALPRGPYPTAVWPEGLTHLPQGGDK